MAHMDGHCTRVRHIFWWLSAYIWIMIRKAVTNEWARQRRKQTTEEKKQCESCAFHWNANSFAEPEKKYMYSITQCQYAHVEALHTGPYELYLLEIFYWIRIEMIKPLISIETIHAKYLTSYFYD